MVEPGVTGLPTGEDRDLWRSGQDQETKGAGIEFPTQEFKASTKSICQGELERNNP